MVNFHKPILVSVCLLALVAIVFGRTIHHPFVPYDDDKYVYSNPHVMAGLTSDGIVWAFTSFEYSNWHPLTWISHMIDVTLFGAKPAGHHLMNLVLHGINSVLIFLIFWMMTGEVWGCFFIAALFAVHPLHVESVAWVAERKDLLSTLVWGLALGSYISYAKSPSRIRYLSVLALYSLGLLCKPMIVTFPFVLLLLDIWPLGRSRIGLREGPGVIPACEIKESFVPLVVEKIPLLVLSFASSVMTYVAQSRGGTIGWRIAPSLATRAANAVVAYVSYLWKTIWPSSLAILYPYDVTSLTAWRVYGATTLLCLFSAYALRTVKSRPWITVGWFWFLGTLVPAIGVIQAGVQSMADRYTYIPLIGIFLILSWEIRKISATRNLFRYAGNVILALSVTVFAVVSWYQVDRWKNSTALYKYALSVTRNNYVMHTNLGAELLNKEGRVDEAIAHFREALRINPLCWEAHYNLGKCLYFKGNKEEADAHYREGRRIRDFPGSN